MQRGVKAEGEALPARNRRWPFGVVPAAFLVASAAVTLGRSPDFAARDRTVIITVGVDGRHFRIPLSPQRDSLVAGAARDEDFTEILAHIRQAHAASA